MIGQLWKRTIAAADKAGPFIMTNRGPFNFFTHEPLDRDWLNPIAYALATTNRFRGLFSWAGHTLEGVEAAQQHYPVMKHWYSVAEHCVKGMELVAHVSEQHGYNPFGPGDWNRRQDSRLRLLWLLHDAPEAFIGDFPNPLKQTLQIVDGRGRNQGSIQDLENDINARLHEGLCLPVATPTEKRVIKDVDRIMFWCEVALLYGMDVMEAVVTGNYGLRNDSEEAVEIRRVTEASLRMFHGDRREWGWNPEKSARVWEASVRRALKTVALSNDSE
jgi:hypothetical protein